MSRCAARAGLWRIHVRLLYFCELQQISFIVKRKMRFLGGLLRAPQALAPRTVLIEQRASYIHGKPPKSKVGAMESVFVLAVMSLTILGPSGWILSHLEHYKSRDMIDTEVT